MKIYEIKFVREYTCFIKAEDKKQANTAAKNACDYQKAVLNYRANDWQFVSIERSEDNDLLNIRPDINGEVENDDKFYINSFNLRQRGMNEIKVLPPPKGWMCI